MHTNRQIFHTDSKQPSVSVQAEVLFTNPGFRHSCIFALFFLFFNLIGWNLQSHLYVDIPSLLLWLAVSVILSPALGSIFWISSEWISGHFFQSPKTPGGEYLPWSDSGYYLVCSILLFLCWIPVFLAYYPGLFAYDVHTQLAYAKTGYSTFHPLLHTLFLNFFYYTVGTNLCHSPTLGIALFVLLQMVIFSLQISYTHLFLRRTQVSMMVRLICFLFSAFLPLISMLAISVTKDTLFSGFFVVLCTCLAYLELGFPDSAGNPRSVLLFFSAMGTVLMRNNGIYALVLYLLVKYSHTRFLSNSPIPFFAFREIKALLAGISAALLLNGLLVLTCHADPGPVREALSVPVQQLAFVYTVRDSELSQKEKQVIETALPDVKKYNPAVSDPVKNTAATPTGETVRTYLKLLLHYPLDYLEAFLHLNLGYFYLFDTTSGSIYGSGLDTRQGYLLSDTKEGFDVHHTSYFPLLESILEQGFSANIYQSIPIINILCSMAFYFWIIVSMVFLCISRHLFCDSAVAVCSLMVTTLFGPCAIPRYFLPEILCIPVLVTTALLLGNKWRKQKTV